MTGSITNWAAAAVFAAVGAVFAAAPAVAQDQTAGGGVTEREAHGDWRVLCRENDKCLMSQARVDEEGRPLVIMHYFKTQPAEGVENAPAVGLYIGLPLGVYLTSGVGFQVDDKPLRGLPYERCDRQGCHIQAGVSEDVIADLKAGGEVKVHVRIQPGQPDRIYSISLKGFTAALDSLS